MIRIILAVLLLTAFVIFGGRWVVDQLQDASTPVEESVADDGNENVGLDMSAGEPPAASAPVDESCRTQQWLDEVLAAGSDVSAVLGQLDRDYNMSDSATWSQPGYTVPANTIVWTDWLPENGIPPGVRAIRVQGTWGAWFSEAALTVPAPNGGGRYTKLCDGVSVGASASADDHQTGQSAAPAASSAATCLTSDQAGQIAAADDQVQAYNDFFEEVGYSFGGTLGQGQSIPIAAFFLGSQPEPSNSAAQLGGPTWIVSEPATAPEGGRWMQFCVSDSSEDAAAPAASPPASDPPGS